MADNVDITQGSGTTIAADDIAGVKHQRVKVVIGADGVNDGDVSASNPIPVTGTVTANTGLTQPLTDTQLRATSVPVSGTFFQATQPISATALPLPSGASSEATLSSINTKTPSLGQSTMVNSQPVAIASNQSAIPVTGTFWQATQPISGTVTANTGLTQPLTDTQLRALAVPVSGTFWQATQPVSGSVSVSNFPASQAVTGTFFPATQPVSIAASVAVTGPLTDTQLRATAVPVSGTVTANAGTNLNTSALALESGGNLASINTKTPALGQALAASSVPVVLTAAQITTLTPPSSVSVSNFPVTQPVSGTVSANATLSAETTKVIGTVNVAASQSIAVTQATGTNLHVVVDSAPTTAVTGTFFQATQPVSIASSVAVTGSLTDTQLRATAVPVSVSSIALPSGASTSALQTTGNSSLSSIDGKTPTLGQALAASSIPVVLTAAQISTLTPLSSVSISNLPSPLAVSGSITSTQNVAINIASYGSISLEITGTWTGTLNFETLVGSTWSPADCFGTVSELVSTSTTSNGVYSFINLAGVTQARVIGNTVTSGTANIVLTANNGQFTYPVYARSVGNTIGSYGIQMGGVDASTNTFQFQKVNTLGAAGVYLESSNKASYSATTIPFTPPATPSDIIRISGSATKIIRILKIVLNTTQNTIGINDWYIIKRSTANIGGTTTAITPVPLDSNFASPTATLIRYNTNATTLGTALGNLAIVNIVSPPTTPGTSGTAYIPYVFDFTNNPIVLRSVNEGVSVNFNGAALPGGLSINCHIMFTEE